MDKNRKNRVCPVEHSGMLELGLRRLYQNPRRILGPYVREGMEVLDYGCGPGFFSVEMARLVGRSGKVIAADFQQGMLDKLREKVGDTGMRDIITLHKCPEDRIGFSGRVDFVLAFYVLHEVPDQSRILSEIRALLRPGGGVLVAEPKFRVSVKEFDCTVAAAEKAGLKVVGAPRVLFSRSVLLQK